MGRVWLPNQAPLVPVEIDRQHDLSRGRVGLIMPGPFGFKDPLSGVSLDRRSELSWATDEPNIVAGPLGPQFAPSSSNSALGAYVPPAWKLAQKVTLAVTWQRLGTTHNNGNPAIFIVGPWATATSPYFNYAIVDDYPNSHLDFMFAASGTLYTHTAASYPAVGSINTAVLAIDLAAGAQKGWLNGVLSFSDNKTGTMSYSADCSAYALNNIYWHTSANDALIAVSIYDRALEEAEALELTQLPFSGLRPTKRRTYSLPGLGTVTLTPVNASSGIIAATAGLTTAVTLPASNAASAVTAQRAPLIAQTTLPPSNASTALTAQRAVLTALASLTAQNAAAALTAQRATLGAGAPLQVAAATIALSAARATVIAATTLTPSAAQTLLQATRPALAYTVSLSPVAASAALTGARATVTAATTLSPRGAAVGLTAQWAQVLTGTSLAPRAASVALIANRAFASSPTSIYPKDAAVSAIQGIPFFLEDLIPHPGRGLSLVLSDKGVVLTSFNKGVILLTADRGIVLE